MTSAPDSVLRTWFEELWNQGKEETISRLLAPDGLIHGLGPGGQALQGPAAFLPFYRRLHAAFPDMRIEVIRTVTEGNMVAIQCHVTGTHTGASLGVPPSHQRVDFWGLGIGRIANGQIAEGWNCFDFLTCFQQIGLLPPLPA
jgi:steroid delta-isomerase-like uncharacterized protein